MPPALGIKEPLGTKESELLELSKGRLSYAGVLGKGSKQRPWEVSRSHEGCWQYEGDKETQDLLQVRWTQYARSSCLPLGTFSVGNRDIRREASC